MIFLWMCDGRISFLRGAAMLQVLGRLRGLLSRRELSGDAEAQDGWASIAD